MTRAEKMWWAGVGLWLLVVVFWHPPPPLLFTQVPSVKKSADGFRIFHDLVRKQATSVRRTLIKPHRLKEENVDVLVLLNPSRSISAEARVALTDLVVQQGKTLIVGYPMSVAGVEGGGTLLDGKMSVYVAHDEPVVRDVTYNRYIDSSSEKVFSMKVAGYLDGDNEEREVLAWEEGGRSLVVAEPLGKGTVIQLASAQFLNNENLGFKRAHMLAAQLVDYVGHNKQWVFDESNEGVMLTPSLTTLVGSGRFRMVFLYFLLVLYFWYWYRTARIGRPREVLPSEEGPDSLALARAVGGFYQRAKNVSWALDSVVDYASYAMEEGNMGQAERQQKTQLIEQAREASLSGNKHESLVAMKALFAFIADQKKKENNDTH